MLAALDIVVFPSLWEGTPLTAFEALAAGKPIVATDADGLLDILTDRQDALVVPKRDAGALARGGRRADRAAARWRRGWRPTRGETGAQYDIGAFVRKMERLYEILHETSRATAARGRPAGRPRAFLTSGKSMTPARAGPPRASAAVERFAWRLGQASTAALGRRAARRGR